MTTAWWPDGGWGRSRTAPLAELGFGGAGMGRALGGLRPIVEIRTVNFSLLARDPIVNTAALYRHMSGGQFGVPVVIRMATGAGRQLAAQHSHSLEPVSYTHLRAHETVLDIVCRLLLEKKKQHNVVTDTTTERGVRHDDTDRRT